MQKKVLLIGNPIAGGGKARRLTQQLVGLLEQRGYQVETFLTRGAGDAHRRARSIEPHVDTLVIVGGDGTVNEVVNGLPDPSRTPIALLPTGTANMLARELSLPKRPGAVARAIEQGTIRWLDVGVLEDRRFLMVVSAGLDAMVTEEVRRTRKERLGYGGYVLPVLRVLGRYRAPELRVTVDEGDVLNGAFALVCNTSNYGGIFTFADQARCDSGHLDICVFPQGTLPALTQYYFAALRGKVSSRTDVTYLTGRRIRIESREPVAVQVDGDPFGTTPVAVQLRAAAVPIVVPYGG